jgi:hypothetical protein
MVAGIRGMSIVQATCADVQAILERAVELVRTEFVYDAVFCIQHLCHRHREFVGPALELVLSVLGEGNRTVKAAIIGSIDAIVRIVPLPPEPYLEIVINLLVSAEPEDLIHFMNLTGTLCESIADFGDDPNVGKLVDLAVQAFVPYTMFSLHVFGCLSWKCPGLFGPIAAFVGSRLPDLLAETDDLTVTPRTFWFLDQLCQSAAKFRFDCTELFVSAAALSCPFFDVEVDSFCRFCLWNYALALARNDWEVFDEYYREAALRAMTKTPDADYIPIFQRIADVLVLILDHGWADAIDPLLFDSLLWVLATGLGMCRRASLPTSDPIGQSLAYAVLKICTMCSRGVDEDYKRDEMFAHLREITDHIQEPERQAEMYQLLRFLLPDDQP